MATVTFLVPVDQGTVGGINSDLEPGDTVVIMAKPANGIQVANFGGCDIAKGEGGVMNPGAKDGQSFIAVGGDVSTKGTRIGNLYIAPNGGSGTGGIDLPRGTKISGITEVANSECSNSGFLYKAYTGETDE